MSYAGETQEAYTYIAPIQGFEQLYGEYSQEQPLGLDNTQVRIRPVKEAAILGTLGLPYSDPADVHHYVSIHCNPPGVLTDQASVVSHDFGKGKTLYVAGDLESNEIYQAIFIRLIRLLQPEFSWDATAPGTVEITCFDQPDKKRVILSLLNFQKDLPNIPVQAVKVRVRLGGGEKASSLVLLPRRRKLAFTSHPHAVEFVIPYLETFQMLALEYS